MESFFGVSHRYMDSTLAIEDTETIFDKAIAAGSVILDMTMAKRVLYVRNGVSDYVWVSNGGLNWRNITAFGEATLEHTQQDFIISRNHPVNPFPYDDPQPGDKLIFATGWEWELMKIDGQECFRPMGRAMIRVHCKRIK